MADSLIDSFGEGPFIATQLNSMSSLVELRRRSVYSDADATELDVELSARSQREQLSPINERSDPVDSVCRS